MKLRARMMATVAVSISLMPAVAVNAQGAGTTPGSTPKVEIFLGYSYFRALPTLETGNRMVDLNGGSASVAFNLNRYLGLVGDFGGYSDTRLRFVGPGATQPDTVDSSGTAYTYLFGPRVSFRNASRFTPFVQALFGGAYASKVTLSGCTGAFCTPLPQQNAFALTAGGGLDIRASRHISIRPIQAEYLMTRFSDPTTGSSNTQNDLRLSAGLVFRLGGNKQPAPPAPQPVAQEPTPQPQQPQPNHAPTLTCVGDRTSVAAGDAVQVTATATDQDHDPLTFSWTGRGRAVLGADSSVRFDTAGLAPGQYTVHGHVTDNHGGTADCAVEVAVVAPAPPAPTALELRLALHSIYFPTAKPTTENPGGGLLSSQKQTLTKLASDFKTYLKSKPDAHLILEGHADPRASAEYNQALSERRVASTKSFLVAQGVPAGNIETKAFGQQQALSEQQVRDAVEQNPDLNPAERQRVLGNLTTITLASNRRVDVTLNTTGQQSLRQFPFNAADALTLLRQKGSPTPHPVAKKGS